MLFPSALERLGRRVPARGGPSPVMQSATVPATGATISLLFSTPVSFGGGGSGGFTLSLTGGAVTMTYQSGSGTATLVYSLSRVLQAGETGSISFTQPGNGVEATAGGTDVTSFSLVTLVNNSTQVPPTHTTTAINTAGTQVSLGFSGTVSFGAGGNGGFVLTMSGGASAMTYVSGNGTSTLVYSLARVIDTGETGTLAYTQPGNGVESSVTTLDVVSFSGHSVTNNSSQRPTLVSATINSAGTSIALLFSKSVSFGAGGNSGLTLSMTGGAVTASYASGSGSTTLTYGLSRTIYQGETGTTSYAQPGNGIEASASGADVSSFSGATVSNGSTSTDGGTVTPTLLSPVGIEYAASYSVGDYLKLRYGLQIGESGADYWNNQPSSSGYMVQMRLNGANVGSPVANLTQYQIQSGQSGGILSFWVTASNSGGTSARAYSAGVLVS